MKAILLSIKPEWLAKILNGEKTIEVRKLFPKKYVGWVYLYCSKSKPYLTREIAAFIYGYDNEPLNGKVVARFWCDNVKKHFMAGTYYENEEQGKRFLEKCCLSLDEFINYRKEKPCYAIYISKLEIFDEPKWLCEFKRYCDIHKNKLSSWTKNKCKNCQHLIDYEGCYINLTKAPQNYCYIEGE